MEYTILLYKEFIQYNGHQVLIKNTWVPQKSVHKQLQCCFMNTSVKMSQLCITIVILFHSKKANDEKNNEMKRLQTALQNYTLILCLMLTFANEYSRDTDLTNMYNRNTPPMPSIAPNMSCQRRKNNDIQNNSCNESQHLGRYTVCQFYLLMLHNIHKFTITVIIAIGSLTVCIIFNTNYKRISIF